MAKLGYWNKKKTITMEHLVPEIVFSFFLVCEHDEYYEFAEKSSVGSLS